MSDFRSSRDCEELRRALIYRSRCCIKLINSSIRKMNRVSARTRINGIKMIAYGPEGGQREANLASLQVNFLEEVGTVTL
eukprot:scaffold7454_cov53-Attheya_sp.AAC.5